MNGSSLLFQIPEYCRVLEESEISEHCFDLIFAFDEIVALGYRENVNLAQIRTFTEMDSHEEKVFRAVREVRCGSACLVGFLLNYSGKLERSTWKVILHNYYLSCKRNKMQRLEFSDFSKLNRRREMKENMRRTHCTG